MEEDKLKNTQNKDKVLDEMNDYISSTMSIPIIKLDDNGEMINKPEEVKEDIVNDVNEIYADKMDEEKVVEVEPVNEEVFPTPPSEVEAVHDTPDPVVEEVSSERHGLDDMKEEDIPTYEPTMESMNVTNETHANLEEPVVPEQAKPKKNKTSLVLVILVLLIGLGALGYFVIYPFIVNRFMSNPKNVFEVTIKDMAKNINTYIDKAPKANALYDINVKFDTNIEDLKAFSGYTYGYRSGIDVDKKLLEASIYMKDPNNTEYSMKTYVKDNKNYLKFSSSDQLIALGDNTVDLAETFKEYEESLNDISTNNNDIQHVVTKVADLFIESLDEKKLSNEKSTITYKGDSVNVEKNTYVMNSDDVVRTMDFILEGLEKDEISKNYLEQDGSSISAMREELKNSKEAFKEIEELKINIYTAGRKKDVIGYDIEANGQKLMSYYWDDKGYELQIYDMEVSLTTGDVVSDKQIEKVNLVVTGTKDGEKTNVSVKMNNEEVATMVVKKWDENNIDLDYVIKSGNNSASGVFKLTYDEGDDFSKLNILFSLQSGSDKIGLEFNLNADYNTKIADIDTSTAIVPTEYELDAMLNQFIGSFANTPIGQLFSTLGGMYGNGSSQELNQYYANNPSADPFAEQYVIG